ncbi:hypothetical protein ACJZ2D_016980 [Fusarium nematophilum]
MEFIQPFNNKVITLTGADSGVGRATAVYLAQRGATLSDINKAPVDAVVGEILAEIPSAKVSASAIDISNADQVKSWISQAVAKFGKLDGAANIAVTASREQREAPVHALTDEDWNFVLNINLTGTM